MNIGGPARDGQKRFGAMQLSRRTLVKTGLVTGGAAALAAATLDTRPSAAATLPRTNPFTLGVASGDPWPTGVVIWTRLAVNPLAANGLGGMSSSTQTVRWQVATDAHVPPRSSGRARWRPRPANAHSVHVEVTGLLPGREYFYRFRLGRYISRVGRTRTAPAVDAACRRPWRCPSSRARTTSAAGSRPTAGSPRTSPTWSCTSATTSTSTRSTVARRQRRATTRGPETVTLANYRQRLAQYKTDPDLQAAHAIAPWLVVFDDHEVENNWADETPENAAPVPGFMTRRAAAFKAYYENMPLRQASIPSGPDMQLHRRLRWGRLANFHMLDTRQYRDDQACGDG